MPGDSKNSDLTKLLLKEIRSIMETTGLALKEKRQSDALKSLHSLKGLFQSDKKENLTEMCHSIEELTKNEPPKEMNLSAFEELSKSVISEYPQIHPEAKDIEKSVDSNYSLQLIIF